MQHLDEVNQAISHIKANMPAGFAPRVGLTLGTGLGGLAQAIEVRARLAYESIPGFPVSTVQSHEGALVLGLLGGQPVAALAGRFHLYEAYTPQQVTMPVRVLAGLGAEAFIFMNAAGGLDLSWEAGRPMLITDHINLTGRNPLMGPNVDAWGERFPDMSQVYDPALMALARDAARQGGHTLYEGVYAGLTGPSMETPAETRMLGVIGAQAVGMSTVLEVIAARHHGLRVLGLSAIANINDPDDMQPAPLELVIENAEKAGQAIGHIAQKVLEFM